jgi:hypothetical protein
MLYRVGVCYRLPGDIQGAVESLQAEGKARIYEEEMRIVSGVAYPAKKPPLPAAAAAEAPVPASPLQARKKARQRA